MNIKSVSIAFITVLACISCADAIPIPKKAIQEALEAAGRTSGKELAEKSAMESAESIIGKSYVKFGDDALAATGHGGFELLEAAAKHGDEVMEFAVKASPKACRALAMDAATLLPLVRRVGVEALEIEAKAPGMASKFFQVFGDDTAKTLAKTIADEDIPRMIKYAEMADTPATRKLLVERYAKEAGNLFVRIPPKLVLATGLSASMLLATNKLPDGDVAPLLQYIAGHGLTVAGVVAAFLALLLLWRFRLLPWHAKK